MTGEKIIKELKNWDTEGEFDHFYLGEHKIKIERGKLGWTLYDMTMRDKFTIRRQLKTFFCGGTIELEHVRIIGNISVSLTVPRWTWLPRSKTYAIEIKYENGKEIFKGIAAE